MWTSVGDTHVFRKEPDGHRWGEQIPILAGLTDKGGGVPGGKVWADVTHPDGTTLRLPLLDDGNHGDGSADDGVYAGVYTRTTEFAKRGGDDPQPEAGRLLPGADHAPPARTTSARPTPGSRSGRSRSTRTATRTRTPTATACRTSTRATTPA